jgi:MFS family permease
VIPVSGWVSERFGTRNAWMFAVAAFLAGSVLCGLSRSLPVLIAFRVLQGYLSHATTAAAALSAFTSTFWWIFGLTAVPFFLAFFIPRRKNEGPAPSQEPASRSAPAPVTSGH